MDTNRAPSKRLYRSRENRIIAGVAGGLAEYLGVDPTIVRILWVLVSLILPPMLLIDIVLYTALAFIIPLEPEGVM